MPWVKLDDKFPDHPKIDGLSDGAFRLHISGLCYAARYLTDGAIPAGQIARLMPRYQPKYLTELVDRVLWVDHGDVYLIHEFTDYNKSREWWEQRRKKDRERIERWRETHRDSDGRFHA